MKKFIAGLMLSAIMPISTVAQNVKVTSANERRWSGGRAGFGGCNTDIIIKSVHTITIDSLYTQVQNTVWGYQLNSPCSGQWGLKVDSVHHNYYLSQSISVTPHLNYNYGDDSFNTTEKQKNPQDNQVKCNNIITTGTGRQFQGEALVTYFYKGQKQFVIVKEIKSLPSISYP